MLNIFKSAMVCVPFILFNIAPSFALPDTDLLEIRNTPPNGIFKPLEWIELHSAQTGNITVQDGNGLTYFREPVRETVRFRAAGALGRHSILLTDDAGKLLETRTFKVDCKTEIIDEGREFSRLLDMLYYTMNTGHTTAIQRYNGKAYTSFAGWFQDHVHVLKAMKYFYPDILTGIDLYADGQRKDGMIYDNYYSPYDTWIHWFKRFGPDFVSVPQNPEMNSSFFVRIPVENMSEFTFLEGVYYAWKASGNDAWMKGKLDNCIKAIEYGTSDPYRWSEKFRLLKRGYTIDIWDFQPEQDIGVWAGDIMMAKPGVTSYSIMYGDNIGMAVGCEYVGEMLEYAGRYEDADRIRSIGRGIKERIDALSWNGSFYTHHIPEDPTVKRDFGSTDESRQVTISNAYAINRRIGHDKSVALIKTYQNLAREMPASSPGEWYLCYPPYEKGWHIDKWEYMNGGVSSIVAGEVAHGAFNHGFEAYGVHILRRMGELAHLSGNRLLCIYRGALPDPPDRRFTPLPLTDIANADISGNGTDGVPGWTGEGNNDLHVFPAGKQVFRDIPFTIVNPDKNGRKACLIISGAEGYVNSRSLSVNDKASSIYFLHTQSGGNHLGHIVIRYADGSEFRKQVNRGENIAGWWYPKDGPDEGGTRPYYVAWEGENEKSLAVGVYVYGMENPHPEKTIRSIDFEGSNSIAKWMILGVTLSDKPVFFMPDLLSYGAPDNWGAAAVVYALLEGLAGVKDDGIAFDKAGFAPRWMAAGVTNVSTTIKYPASGGYLSYDYAFDETSKRIKIDFTGNASDIDIKILLMPGQEVSDILLNGKKAIFEVRKTESSRYVCLSTEGVSANELILQFK